jgi:copper chaperone CopZ
MKVVLSVPDMSCGHCVARIKGALEEIGVECLVDLGSRTAVVDHEDEAAARLKLDDIDYPAAKNS